MSTPANDWRDALAALMPDMPEAEGASKGTTEPEATDAPVERATLHVEISRKGRAGKVATIIHGFSETTTDDDIETLAATLKRRLGTGGSARGGEILIQGDRRADILAALKSLGYKAK